MNFTNRRYFNVTIPYTLFTPVKPAVRVVPNLRVYTATDGLKKSATSMWERTLHTFFFSTSLSVLSVLPNKHFPSVATLFTVLDAVNAGELISP
jgi:hypothetical protein